MGEELSRFLAESPLAGKIRLPARVVVRRTRLSPHDVNAVKAAGVYGPIPKDAEVCELEIGGRRIAQGTLVKKRGAYHFKVSRLLDEPDNKEASL